MSLNKEEFIKKIESLTLKTYGPHRPPAEKEYMTHDELIAMSPQGAHQSTKVSQKFAKHRESLPPVLKKALKYLYPCKNFQEKPPVSIYDSMVRKMSLLSLTPAELSPKRLAKRKKNDSVASKLRGMFDFKEDRKFSESVNETRPSDKARNKLPQIKKTYLHGRFASVDFINCINFTGEAESEYLKTLNAQKEYRKVYELTLIESGLYQEIRIRHQNKNRIHYKRIPA